MTNFRLFQTERVCRRQFQIWRKWKKVIQTGRKHCGKKEKLLVASNFSFPHSVFKRLVSQGRQKVSLCGNGLKCKVLSLLHKTPHSTKSKHLKVALLILGRKFYKNTKNSFLYSKSLLIFFHKTPVVENHPTTREVRELLRPRSTQTGITVYFYMSSSLIYKLEIYRQSFKNLNIKHTSLLQERTKCVCETRMPPKWSIFEKCNPHIWPWPLQVTLTLAPVDTYWWDMPSYQIWAL